jgi:lysyl-tRNA synthetase class 2
LKTIDWPVFQTRGKVLALIRSFFTERGFLEVESPILTPYPTLDMNILSMESCFVNNSDAPYTLYLHTSPEHAMKKMLALGAERIFYLGKVFRNSELSDMHHPEFTMLEWYRPHADLQTMQQDTTELIVFLAEQCLDSPVIQVNKHNISLSLPWQEATLRHCFLKKTGFDLIADKSLAGLQACANALGIHYGEGDDWQTLFFRIFLERIESSLGIETPLFLSEYPAEMALMARTKPAAPEWVERSEL